jgi:hypothetical protein
MQMCLRNNKEMYVTYLHTHSVTHTQMCPPLTVGTNSSWNSELLERFCGKMHNFFNPAIQRRVSDKHMPGKVESRESRKSVYM